MGKNKTNKNKQLDELNIPSLQSTCQPGRLPGNSSHRLSLSSTLFYSSTQPENRPGVLLSEGVFITSGMGVVLTALKTESRVSGRRRGQV